MTGTAASVDDRALQTGGNCTVCIWGRAADDDDDLPIEQATRGWSKWRRRTATGARGRRPDTADRNRAQDGLRRSRTTFKQFMAGHGKMIETVARERSEVEVSGGGGVARGGRYTASDTESDRDEPDHAGGHGDGGDDGDVAEEISRTRRPVAEEPSCGGRGRCEAGRSRQAAADDGWRDRGRRSGRRRERSELGSGRSRSAIVGVIEEIAIRRICWR